MTWTRLLTPRWLAAGGAVILAIAIGVALLLQNSGFACAAPPSTAAKTGKATFYDLAGGTGNCSFPSAPANDLFVALGPEQYSAGAACGTYLDVTGPKGNVRVKVIDACPECAAGHLDLSRTAFKQIGAEVAGIVPITYKTVVDPSVPGPISVRVKEGSSRYWLAALIDNHANQLSSVTVNGKRTHREDYNFWTVDSGAGSGPFTIKITDVYGRSTTVSSIKLAPGVTQKTSSRLSRSAARAASPSVKKEAVPSPSSAGPILAPTLAVSPDTIAASPSGDPSADAAKECG